MSANRLQIDLTKEQEDKLLRLLELCDAVRIATQYYNRQPEDTFTALSLRTVATILAREAGLPAGGTDHSLVWLIADVFTELAQPAEGWDGDEEEAD